VRGALEHLSEVLNRPMNQLVNEALEDFVARRSRQVEQDLETALTRLRAYRARDPHFREAIASAVEAEAQLGQDDPAQGKVVTGEFVNGHLVESAEETGSVQSKIHRLLNAS
jgi:predicted transcriptional regulator